MIGWKFELDILTCSSRSYSFKKISIYTRNETSVPLNDSFYASITYDFFENALKMMQRLLCSLVPKKISVILSDMGIILKEKLCEIWKTREI